MPHRLYLSEQDFYDYNNIKDCDISGGIVIDLAGFGVRCHKWRLCYENGFNDGNEDFSLNLEQKHKPRLFYEIELSKPSGYVFQKKHRHILSRQGFSPVDTKAYKPWTRITTRLGVVFEKGRPKYLSSYLRLMGNATPSQLYHKTEKFSIVYDTNI